MRLEITFFQLETSKTVLKMRFFPKNLSSAKILISKRFFFTLKVFMKVKKVRFDKTNETRKIKKSTMQLFLVNFC